MRTLAVVPDAALHHDLVAALGKYPEIELVRYLASYPEPADFLRILRARRPNFVFISVQDGRRFEALASAVDTGMPGVPVIAVGHDSAPVELMSKLMHLGVRDLVSPPITPEKLGQTIASVARQLDRHPASLIRMADLYAFLPAKPGVGSSTITVSTSCALANQLHVRTLLLDCDLTAGITKFLLKLGSSSSIVNALAHAESLDEDLWSQMVGHWDGLEILHAGELDPPTTLTAESVEVVLGLARTQYDTICADLASSLDPFSIQLMHEARRIFLVTTPELVPLHMAADRFRHLQELGLSESQSAAQPDKSPAPGVIGRGSRGARGNACFLCLWQRLSCRPGRHLECCTGILPVELRPEHYGPGAIPGAYGQRAGSLRAPSQISGVLPHPVMAGSRDGLARLNSMAG